MVSPSHCHWYVTCCCAPGLRRDGALRAPPGPAQAQLAISIATAVPAAQALSLAGRTRPAGPIDSESVCPPGAVTLC